jgi:tetratricopeptide (TPR) repeat protein
MRCFPFALLFCVALVGLRAGAQQADRNLSGQGLQTASEPHRFELPSPSATLEELESRAEEFRRQKAWVDAVDYYRAALPRSHDKQARAALHNKIGICDLQLERFRDAEKSFERALKLQSDLVEARNNLGVSFYLEKKYSKAIKEYREAVRLEDDNASFHSNLATALFAQKERDAAMAEYVRAFQLDPTVFERTARGGISAKVAGPEDQARRAEYSYMLARMYAKMGDLDHSLLYLKKAMEDGFKGVNNVYKDTEFTALRADPRFTQLMASRPVAIPE